MHLNPDGARSLLLSLPAAPGAVAYIPEDRFGPLGHMVIDTEAPTSSAVTPHRFRRPSLPAHLHGQAETFHQEWLARSITKAELADAVEECLMRAGEDIPTYTGGWRVVFGNFDGGRDPLVRVFPNKPRPAP